MRELLAEPGAWIIIAGFIVLVGFPLLAWLIVFTSTRRWHDRHHRNHASLMCDHCIGRMFSR